MGGMFCANVASLGLNKKRSPIKTPTVRIVHRLVHSGYSFWSSLSARLRGPIMTGLIRAWESLGRHADIRTGREARIQTETVNSQQGIDHQSFSISVAIGTPRLSPLK